MVYIYFLYLLELHISRLAFPLCYNYLTMMNLADANDKASIPPSFIVYFGAAVKLTPLFGDGYNDWLPYIILIYSILVLLKLHVRILSLLRITKYSSLSSNNPDVEEGRSILDQGDFFFVYKRINGNSSNIGRKENESSGCRRKSHQ